MKILAFSGSNSSTSINQQLIHAVAPLVDFAEVEIIDLRDYPAPLFGVDLEKSSGYPESMQTLNAKFNDADAFIVSSPEHNGSMPAFFKNALDWISRISTNKIFKEKPCVFLAASPGARGGASVLDHLLTIMPYRGAQVIGGHGVGSFSEKVVGGVLQEGDDKDKIVALFEKLKARR